MKSLARPGGNITGLSNMGGETGAKAARPDRFPSMPNAVPRRPAGEPRRARRTRAIAGSVRDAATKVGVAALVVEASTPREIEDAFAVIVREKADALIVGAAPFLSLQRQQLAELALKIPDSPGVRATAR